jgi:hypothetical protein
MLFKTNGLLIVGLVLMGISATAAQGAISEAEALNTAIHYTRTKGGDSGSLQISSPGASTYSRAQQVFNGPEGSLPLAEGPQARATSYAFVLVGSRIFQPNTSHPPGRQAPSGKYMGLIVDAKVNEVDGLYLGSTPPDIAALGTPATINLAAGAETASTSCRADRLLSAALARRHLNTRYHRAELAYRRCLDHRK